VERAADVVRRLRALIRLDRSGRAPVSVERIVRESLDLVRPQLDRHNVAARVQLASDLPPVLADLLQIEQVMLNLLRNSIEAMDAAGHPGGMITITAARFGPNHVEIEVRDTGPGFPAEFADAYLLPLSSTKDEGLGVGLALCRSIVESHDGQLLAGGGISGAQVRFRLPTAEAASG
jgi:signal transduction histidine kinase